MRRTFSSEMSALLGEKWLIDWWQDRDSTLCKKKQISKAEIVDYSRNGKPTCQGIPSNVRSVVMISFLLVQEDNQILVGKSARYDIQYDAIMSLKMEVEMHEASSQLCILYWFWPFSRQA
ncbi:hypothetical protein SASPL_133170 [Salvia splendens]|uniref:Uncharacterized protein n=1 Tax=Salvia splendens TaxID=180675 RepID=A0A8X8X3T1_SALSN|nr:hypothetical protein SASPL_133170 [Salvia splendens]